MHRVYKDSTTVYKCHTYIIDGKCTNSTRKPKPIIMMLHGLADSSDGFIMNDKDKSPAFIFAEKGYDIWLPDTRGNKYSRNHTTLNPDVDTEYWDHSFTDISREDMPVFFNYIRNVT